MCFRCVLKEYPKLKTESKVLTDKVKQLRAVIGDIVAGRRRVVWGWDEAAGRMGHWMLSHNGIRTVGQSYKTAIEAIEAAEATVKASPAKEA